MTVLFGLGLARSLNVETRLLPSDSAVVLSCVGLAVRYGR